MGAFAKRRSKRSEGKKKLNNEMSNFIGNMPGDLRRSRK